MSSPARSSSASSPVAALLGRAGSLPGACLRLAARPWLRRRRERVRIALDIDAMASILPALQTYERRLTGLETPPVRPEIAIDPDMEPRYETDPNADLLAQIEQGALGVRSVSHWELRDMLVSVVLSNEFRNEYFVRCLVHRVSDRIAGK